MSTKAKSGRGILSTSTSKKHARNKTTHNVILQRKALKSKKMQQDVFKQGIDLIIAERVTDSVTRPLSEPVQDKRSKTVRNSLASPKDKKTVVSPKDGKYLKAGFSEQSCEDCKPCSSVSGEGAEAVSSVFEDHLIELDDSNDGKLSLREHIQNKKFKKTKAGEKHTRQSPKHKEVGDKQVVGSFNQCRRHNSLSSKLQKKSRLLNELRKLKVDVNSDWNTIQVVKRRPKYIAKSNLELKENKKVRKKSKLGSDSKKCDPMQVTLGVARKPDVGQCINGKQSEFSGTTGINRDILLSNKLNKSHIKSCADKSQLRIGRNFKVRSPGKTIRLKRENKTAKSKTVIRKQAKGSINTRKTNVLCKPNKKYKYENKFVACKLEKKVSNQSKSSTILRKCRKYNMAGKAVERSYVENKVKNDSNFVGNSFLDIANNNESSVADRESLPKNPWVPRYLGLKQLLGQMVDNSGWKLKGQELNNLIVDDNLGVGWNKPGLEPRSTRQKALNTATNKKRKYRKKLKTVNPYLKSHINRVTKAHNGIYRRDIELDKFRRKNLYSILREGMKDFVVQEIHHKKKSARAKIMQGKYYETNEKGAINVSNSESAGSVATVDKDIHFMSNSLISHDVSGLVIQKRRGRKPKKTFLLKKNKDNLITMLREGLAKFISSEELLKKIPIHTKNPGKQTASIESSVEEVDLDVHNTVTPTNSKHLKTMDRIPIMDILQMSSDARTHADVLNDSPRLTNIGATVWLHKKGQKKLGRPRKPQPQIQGKGSVSSNHLINQSENNVGDSVSVKKRGRKKKMSGYISSVVPYKDGLDHSLIRGKNKKTHTYACNSHSKQNCSSQAVVKRTHEKKTENIRISSKVAKSKSKASASLKHKTTQSTNDVFQTMPTIFKVSDELEKSGISLEPRNNNIPVLKKVGRPLKRKPKISSGISSAIDCAPMITAGDTVMKRPRGRPRKKRPLDANKEVNSETMCEFINCVSTNQVTSSHCKGSLGETFNKSILDNVNENRSSTPRATVTDASAGNGDSLSPQKSIYEGVSVDDAVQEDWVETRRDQVIRNKLEDWVVDEDFVEEGDDNQLPEVVGLRVDTSDESIYEDCPEMSSSVTDTSLSTLDTTISSCLFDASTEVSSTGKDDILVLRGNVCDDTGNTSDDNMSDLVSDIIGVKIRNTVGGNSSVGYITEGNTSNDLSVSDSCKESIIIEETEKDTCTTEFTEMLEDGGLKKVNLLLGKISKEDEVKRDLFDKLLIEDILDEAVRLNSDGNVADENRLHSVSDKKLSEKEIVNIESSSDEVVLKGVEETQKGDACTHLMDVLDEAGKLNTHIVDKEEMVNAQVAVATSELAHFNHADMNEKNETDVETENVCKEESYEVNSKVDNKLTEQSTEIESMDNIATKIEADMATVAPEIKDKVAIVDSETDVAMVNRGMEDTLSTMNGEIKDNKFVPDIEGNRRFKYNDDIQDAETIDELNTERKDQDAAKHSENEDIVTLDIEKIALADRNIKDNKANIDSVNKVGASSDKFKGSNLFSENTVDANITESEDDEMRLVICEDEQEKNVEDHTLNTSEKDTSGSRHATKVKRKRGRPKKSVTKVSSLRDTPKDEDKVTFCNKQAIGTKVYKQIDSVSKSQKDSEIIHEPTEAHRENKKEVINSQNNCESSINNTANSAELPVSSENTSLLLPTMTKKRKRQFDSGKKVNSLGVQKIPWNKCDMVTSSPVRPPIKMTFSKKPTNSNIVSFEVVSTSLSDVERSPLPDEAMQDPEETEDCKPCYVILTDFVKQLNFDEISESNEMDTSNDLSAVESIECVETNQSGNVDSLIEESVVTDSEVVKSPDKDVHNNNHYHRIDMTVVDRVSDISEITINPVSAFQNPNFSHLICGVCPFTAKDCLSMENHIFTHSDLMPITCGYCSCKYFSKLGYMTHRSNTHEFEADTLFVKNHDGYYEVMLRNHKKMLLSAFYLFAERNATPVESSPTKPHSSTSLNFDQAVVDKLRSIKYMSSPKSKSPRSDKAHLDATSYQTRPQDLVSQHSRPIEATGFHSRVDETDSHLSQAGIRSMPHNNVAEEDWSPPYTGRYVCTYCMFSVNDRGKIVEHVAQIHADDNIYACAFCESKFSTNLASIEEHLHATHAGQAQSYKRLPNFFDREEFRCQQTLHPSTTNILDRISSSDIELTETQIKHYTRARDVMNFRERHNQRGFEADSTTPTTPFDEVPDLDDATRYTRGHEANMIGDASLRRIRDDDSGAMHQTNVTEDKFHNPAVVIARSADLSAYFDDRRLDACRHCGEVIANNASLKHHIESVHGIASLFSCAYCDRFIHSIDYAVYNHIHQNHAEQPQNTRLKVIADNRVNTADKSDSDVVFVGQSFLPGDKPHMRASAVPETGHLGPLAMLGEATDRMLRNSASKTVQKAARDASKSAMLSGIVSRLQAISAAQALQRRTEDGPPPLIMAPDYVAVASDHRAEDIPSTVIATTATKRLLKVPVFQTMARMKHTDTVVSSITSLRTTIEECKVSTNVDVLDLSVKLLTKDDISPDAFKIFNISPEKKTEDTKPLNLSVKMPALDYINDMQAYSARDIKGNFKLSPCDSRQFPDHPRPNQAHTHLTRAGIPWQQGTTAALLRNQIIGKQINRFNASVANLSTIQSGPPRMFPRPPPRLLAISASSTSSQPPPLTRLPMACSPANDSIEVLRQLGGTSAFADSRMRHAPIVKCPKCYFTTTTKETLGCHIISDHTRKFYCPYCPTPVPLSKYTVPLHIQEHHPNSMVMFVPM